MTYCIVRFVCDGKLGKTFETTYRVYAVHLLEVSEEIYPLYISQPKSCLNFYHDNNKNLLSMFNNKKSRAYIIHSASSNFMGNHETLQYVLLLVFVQH